MEGEDFEVIDNRGKVEEPDRPVVEPQQEKKDSVVKKIMTQDILGAFIRAGLINREYQVGTVSGKIEKMGECHRVQKVDPPWLFTKNGVGRNCQWQLHKAQVFRFVPRRCRNCWKIVVYPRNIVDLMKLYDLQKQMAHSDPTCLCKCGIELRPEVERNYGGYFYTDSRVAGLERLKIVRSLVAEFISPEIRVILKRGCTEFERDFGDSKEWDQFVMYNALEEEIERQSYIVDDHNDQPPLVVNHVLATWMQFAASIADPAFKELSDGENMYADYSTYEEEEDAPKEKRNQKERTQDEGRIKVYREQNAFDKTSA
jgi:hypothetical protein